MGNSWSLVHRTFRVCFSNFFFLFLALPLFTLTPVTARFAFPSISMAMRYSKHERNQQYSQCGTNELRLRLRSHSNVINWT
ncbi:hypothetical protein BDZ91DRAFT_367843 [Kalaharituber pfeilii]|nr:hypothetical protein BDZ91DRAFT_367843 [Kalaharituber pfeilii]